ncbi:TadE family protein [Microbacterium sp. zg.B48]|uniref:TadE family protein n=1 Tax=Microbacterium sp. zg.B48 TaxID=2969408 RepID=UPI00214BFABB|nr:TadE family protein [Microbacterium sp. zg.B48]MCR2763526.1 TadE family protein [Microbacterium sp. zg.B48]
MHRWNPSSENERGSAALEFILVGVVLLVPLVYLVVSLGLIQGQALGAEAGARHIARALSVAEDADAARAGADRILSSVVDEYGLDPESVRVALECRPAGATCPEAGATLVVTLTTTVTLPLVPPVLGLDRFAAVPVQASAVQKVSRFWEPE